MIALLVGLPLSLPCPASIPAARVQDEEVADDRADVAEQLDELADHGKARGEEDDRAIAVIDRLTAEYPDLGPKDRARVVKALAGCLRWKRPLEREQGVPDDRVFAASAVALGTMAPEGVEPLLDALKGRQHRNRVGVLRWLLRSLGKTADPRAADALVDRLSDRRAELVAEAAAALGHFAGAPGDLRKEIAGGLIDVLEEESESYEKHRDDPEMVERWGLVAGPILDGLRAVTGASPGGAEAWRAWWKEHRKEDWDAS